MTITVDDIEKIKDTSINSRLLYAIATGDTSELDDIEVNTVNAMLLKYIAINGVSGGGGSGGTTNYNALVNKPSINSIKLEGDKTLDDLGIEAKDNTIVKDSSYVHTDNNYTNEDKSKLDSLINYDDTDIKNNIETLNNTKVDKVSGKSLISDSEITRLASVDNYDDTEVKASINTVANGLMDSAGYSADYKKIEIVTKAGDKKEIDVLPIISHANLGELSDIDSTDKGNGKTLVYDSASGKHKYVDSTGTDELVKMDSTTDSKYLCDLVDKETIVNDNGTLKAKSLDGLDASISELNYVKGLTMPVQDLVNMFANGGLKTIDDPFPTYADLTAYDVSTLLDGVNYLTRVLADETRDNKITAYMIKKGQTAPKFYGYLDTQRDFTTNPISLSTEVKDKLKAKNIDVDDLFALLTLSDVYKTATTKDEIFGTNGAKAMYDELLTDIGNKANSDTVDNHINDTDIHVSTTDKDTWNTITDKANQSDLDNHTGDTVAHITADERNAWNGKIDKTNIATTIDSNSTDEQVASALTTYRAIEAVNTSLSGDISDVSDALTTHANDTDIHVTATKQANWDNKVDKKSYFVNQTLNAVTTTTIDISSINHGSYHYKLGVLGSLNKHYFSEGSIHRMNTTYGMTPSYVDKGISLSLSGTTLTVTCSEGKFWGCAMAIELAENWVIS